MPVEDVDPPFRSHYDQAAHPSTCS
jgi:hypothetical protein